MITKPRLKTLTASKDCVLRTVSSYNAVVEKVREDASLSTVYGVVCSPLYNLQNFHPIFLLPPDITHDLLEGCCAKEMKLILNYAVNSRFITWKQINNLLNGFQFKGADKSNKPGPELKKKIKGKAVQIWCFMRLFGVLFADYFPKNDQVWSTWKLLRQLVDISFAPSFDIDRLPKFKEICERHLATVVENFPNSSVSPKQHYTIHYPYLLEQHGLLSLASCLRFKGVHQVHKQFASNSKNFKNIQYTMACKFRKGLFMIEL